jgi:hypothetical protein
LQGQFHEVFVHRGILGNGIRRNSVDWRLDGQHCLRLGVIVHGMFGPLFPHRLVSGEVLVMVLRQGEKVRGSARDFQPPQTMMINQLSTNVSNPFPSETMGPTNGRRSRAFQNETNALKRTLQKKDD